MSKKEVVVSNVSKEHDNPIAELEIGRAHV